MFPSCKRLRATGTDHTESYEVITPAQCVATTRTNSAMGAAARDSRAMPRSLDDTPLREGALLGVGVAELGQDLSGVLAEQRRGAIHRARRLRELDGNAEGLDGAGAGMCEV